MSQNGFFVYVIESPSAPDLYHQRSEADLLRQAINLDLIPCVTRCAINGDAFLASLHFGLAEEMEAFPQLLPIIHISAHGNAEGIALSNGEVISWEHLKQLLQPINAALQGFLLVCMSSCEGYAGTRMAMFTDNQAMPFFALVGCSGKPTWSDTAVAYATFYHLLAKGHNVDQSVAAMRTASGNEGFFLSRGEQVKKDYIEFVNKQNTARLRDMLAALRRSQQQQPSGQLEKLARLESPTP